MGHEAIHDLLIGVLYAAQIAAEAVLVQLFVGFGDLREHRLAPVYK